MEVRIGLLLQRRALQCNVYGAALDCFCHGRPFTAGREHGEATATAATTTAGESPTSGTCCAATSFPSWHCRKCTEAQAKENP